MIEPIKAGDVCIVIDGLAQVKSPNIGKIVHVRKAIGEHSVHGRMFQCTGNGIMQLADNGEFTMVGWADFPAKWLKKIDPTKLRKELEKVLKLEA